MTDPRDDKLRAMLSAAWGAPRPGWDARALAAMADVRPRRHPNLLTYIIVAALILLLAAGLFAAVRHFLYVEGTLHFHDMSYNPDASWADHRLARWFSGDLEWRTEQVHTRLDGDISPVSGEIVFHAGPWPGPPYDIFKGKLILPEAGESVVEGEVNLTEAAGVGGVNCRPRWSPDGTMIAFEHCDPVEGISNCQVGFDLWVMHADGSDAHRVTPEGTPHTRGASWSPDGSRLLTWMGEWDGEQIGAISTDIWGTDVHVLPNVGSGAAWSPDGSMIASEQSVEATVDGRLGVWRQLLLTDADGADPRVLVQQFIVRAEVEVHYPTKEQMERLPSADFWLADVQNWAGPYGPVWSPSSDKIAFLAALPFDPHGPFYKEQVEVWVYDLKADELIRITDDDVGQVSIVWK